MRKLSSIDLFAIIFTIIGGINMGLMGIFDIDYISYLLGDMTVFSRIIHIIIGVCALYLLIILFRLRRK